MSKLRRTLSLRRKNSYATLPSDSSLFKTPPVKITTLKGINVESESGKDHTSRQQSTTVKLGKKENLENLNTAGNDSGKQQKHGAFSGLHTMRSALVNIGQKLKRKQYKRVALRESPRMVNSAYTTPRRSERIKSQGAPSPLSLKMYSPFCIETPGMDDSFSRISKRKALADIEESPLAKTPRRMVTAAVKAHKNLARSISSTEVIVPTFGGY